MASLLEKVSAEKENVSHLEDEPLMKLSTKIPSVYSRFVAEIEAAVPR